MMITKIFITLLFSFSLLFIGCSKKEETKERTDTTKMTKESQSEKNDQNSVQDEVNMGKNELDLKDIFGKNYHVIADYRGLIFEDFKGKIIVLDFFATWCPPCKAEMPHLVNLQKKYEGKVQFISILMEKDRDNKEIEEFYKEFNMNFPLMNSQDNILLAQALGGIRSLPTLVIFTPEGEYFSHFLGAAPEEMIAAKIDELIKKSR
jgi:thiol-disulfide isomerase/thioredoxin